MVSKGIDCKRLVTILGPVEYGRSRYECPACQGVRYPGDEELDVVGTTRTPGTRRLMARAGSRQPFKEAREDLHIYAGIEVSAKDVERVAEQTGEEVEQWRRRECASPVGTSTMRTVTKAIPVMYIEMDGTGVPMVKNELTGRRGKQADGTARTREAKVGCVFTQTDRDDEGYPVRDLSSTSFVGAIETAEEFGERLEAEAHRRNVSEAVKVVVLGDGAAWIRGIVEYRFPYATQIIDLYHAKEHVATLAKIMFPVDESERRDICSRWWDFLAAGKVEKILRAVQELKKKFSYPPQAQECIAEQVYYLMENKDRMRYAEFRKQGFFVGSGVIEACCRHLVGSRLKQSGMEWSVRGANAIIALRCAMLSNRFEDYWADRVA